MAQDGFDFDTELALLVGDINGDGVVDARDGQMASMMPSQMQVELARTGRNTDRRPVWERYPERYEGRGELRAAPAAGMRDYVTSRTAPAIADHLAGVPGMAFAAGQAGADVYHNPSANALLGAAGGAALGAGMRRLRPAPYGDEANALLSGAVTGGAGLALGADPSLTVGAAIGAGAGNYAVGRAQSNAARRAASRQQAMTDVESYARDIASQRDARIAKQYADDDAAIAADARAVDDFKLRQTAQPAQNRLMFQPFERSQADVLPETMGRRIGATREVVNGRPLFIEQEGGYVRAGNDPTYIDARSRYMRASEDRAANRISRANEGVRRRNLKNEMASQAEDRYADAVLAATLRDPAKRDEFLRMMEKDPAGALYELEAVNPTTQAALIRAMERAGYDLGHVKRNHFQQGPGASGPYLEGGKQNFEAIQKSPTLYRRRPTAWNGRTVDEIPDDIND